jgi:hypothetical protein
MIFNLMKPVPVQTATMYLYGHEADKTVTYNGVELPELPEWDKVSYPYAVIVYKTEPNYSVYFSKTPFYWDMYVTNWHADGTESIAYDYDTETETWVYKTTYETYTQFTSSTKLLWSNRDIAKKSDGTLVLSASDPVTTYENADVTINGVGYVGAVLPKLPEWDKTAYPYAVIVGDADGSNSVTPTRLILSTVPLHYASNNIIYPFLLYGSADGACIGYEWTSPIEGIITYEPGFVRDESLDSTFSTGGMASGRMFYNDLVWANYDVYDHANGTTLVLSACDEPIPVYE